MAFPPAPYHEINGIVRDELGRTLMGEDVKIILISDNGKVVQGSIGNYNNNGFNYKLKKIDNHLLPDYLNSTNNQVKLKDWFD